MENLDYHAENAKINLLGTDGKLQLEADKKARDIYLNTHIAPRTITFPTPAERIQWLIDNNYYQQEAFAPYTTDFINHIHTHIDSLGHQFDSFMGAFKFYMSYAMRTRDGKNILETFPQRAVAVALTLAEGNENDAIVWAEEIVKGTYQPATPTFLNLGKAAAGGPVSCFITEVSDDMEGIARVINDALQLSKRGGGVGINLSNIREIGAPIKGMENMSSGLVPVMKLLEDSFSYANQLGARQGAGVVYVHAHHPDIMRVLDTKRENADEKIRIKTLSAGIIVPNITFELAKRNEKMQLFSPYDVEREYGVPFADIDVTAEYENMVNNPRIRKYGELSARRFFQTVAELQFESGYPYLIFIDHANAANNIHGRIKTSNLCSEILQVSTPSTFNPDGSFKTVGRDISCNLGSLNIAKVMDEGGRVGAIVRNGIRQLTRVSDTSNIDCSPTIIKGNTLSHAVGLGAMNLHGFLAREHVIYGSQQSIEFVDAFFRTVRFHALNASNELAQERGETFYEFDKSKYATGEAFDEYVNADPAYSQDTLDLLVKFNFHVPTSVEWRELRDRVKQTGLYNAYLMAVAPTGSISYITGCTASLHPVTAAIEARKEGKLGRVYYPMPFLSDDTMPYYRTAYDMDMKDMIDVYAAATKHVDQGISCTLFMRQEDTTTKTLNRIYAYAFSKGLKSLYYTRIRTRNLEGTGVDNLANSYCESCVI